jgi:hypothetical protein
MAAKQSTSLLNGSQPSPASRLLQVVIRIFMRADMKNDNLRADRDDLDDLDRFTPRAPAKQRGNNLVMQVAAGVFLGGLALWLVQLGATALYAKLMLGTITFGG